MILSMEVSTKTFVSTLKRSGYSVTKTRKLVFNVLYSNDPLTITDIFKNCHGELDRVTVYRTVALFEKLQITQRLNFGWKYKIELSSPYQLHHHHFTCLKCLKIIALPEDEILETRLALLAANGSFQAVDHQLEIRGRCQDCAEN